MKIIITETQLRKLIERLESGESANPIKEYPGTDVMVTAPITDVDGETINSKNTTSDDYASNRTPDSAFFRGRSMVSRQG